MKRGEIWTIAGGGDYTGKARPVVILQDDRFDDLESVTVCACTTDPTDLPLIRVRVTPSQKNGLRATTRVMADKIIAVRRTRLRARIGELEGEEMRALGLAVMVFLGLADTGAAAEVAEEV